MIHQPVEKKKRKRKSPESDQQPQPTKNQRLDMEDIAVPAPNSAEEIAEEYDLLREYLNVLIPSFDWERVQNEGNDPKYASILLDCEQAKYIANKLQGILSEATIEVYLTKDTGGKSFKGTQGGSYRVAISKINTKYLQTMACSLQENRIERPITDPEHRKYILSSSMFSFPSLPVYQATLEASLLSKTRIAELIEEQWHYIKRFLDEDLSLDREIYAIKKLVTSLRQARKKGQLGDPEYAIDRGDYWPFRWQLNYALKVTKTLKTFGQWFKGEDHEEDTEIIRDLIIHRIDLNYIFQSKCSRPEHSTSLKLLVASGVKINQFFLGLHNRGDTPLTLLMKNKASDDTLQFLIAAKCDLNTRDFRNDSPLHYSINQFEEDFIKLLIQNGAILTLNKLANNILHSAVTNQNTLSLIQFLVSTSPSTALQRNTYRNTPLYLGAVNLERGNFSQYPETAPRIARTVEYLIKTAPKCLQWKNVSGQTPLTYLNNFLTRSNLLAINSSTICDHLATLADHFDAQIKRHQQQLQPPVAEIKLLDNKTKPQALTSVKLMPDNWQQVPFANKLTGSLNEKKVKTTRESYENLRPQTLYNFYLSRSSDSGKRDRKSQRESMASYYHTVVNLLPDDEHETITYDLPLTLLKILIPDLNWQRNLLATTPTYEVVNLNETQAKDIMAQLEIAFADYPVDISSELINSDEKPDQNSMTQPEIVFAQYLADLDLERKKNYSSDENNYRVHISGANAELLKVAAVQLLERPVVLPLLSFPKTVMQYALLPYLCMFDFNSEQEYTSILLTLGVSKADCDQYVKEHWQALDQLDQEKDKKENPLATIDSNIKKLATILQQISKSKNLKEQAYNIFVHSLCLDNYWTYKACLRKNFVSIEDDNLIGGSSKLAFFFNNNNSLDITKDILISGANVHFSISYPREDIPSPITGNPLHVALHRGHFDIANLLISAGADVNIVGIQYVNNKSLFKTPLMLAAAVDIDDALKAKQQLETVQLLVESGAEINTIIMANIDTIAEHEIPAPSSALKIAAEAGNYSIVRYLVKKGADIDFIDHSNLLHFAFSPKMTAELFIYLVDVLKLSLLQPNKLNITPLDLLTIAELDTGRTLLHHWAEKIAEDQKFCYVFIWLGYYYHNFCRLYKSDITGKTPMSIIAAKNQPFARYFKKQVLPLAKKLQQEEMQLSQTSSSSLPLTHDNDSKDNIPAELLASSQSFFHQPRQPAEIAIDLLEQLKEKMTAIATLAKLDIQPVDLISSLETIDGVRDLYSQYQLSLAGAEFSPEITNAIKRNVRDIAGLLRQAGRSQTKILAGFALSSL